MAVGLEVCVDTIDCAILAANSGASRIELCAALSEGGLTPSFGMMAAAADLPVPIYVMIRPRAGGFDYSAAEISSMKHDIIAAKKLGLAGVVFGVLHADGTLDCAVNAELLACAEPMGCTLHRAFDLTPDPEQALMQAIDLGFERVLTSGKCAKAMDGLGLIARLVKIAKDQISIMPGSGITAENVRHIVQKTGVSEVHGSCSSEKRGDGLFDTTPRRTVDADELARMTKVLAAIT
ncbi:MAG: copper homeostasis protein CutC [Rhodobacteraceae bacterium]|nr:copper homeostasis protein CutC [Paracoccaceae bacterium]